MHDHSLAQSSELDTGVEGDTARLECLWTHDHITCSTVVQSSELDTGVEGDTARLECLLNNGHITWSILVQSSEPDAGVDNDAGGVCVPTRTRTVLPKLLLYTKMNLSSIIVAVEDLITCSTVVQSSGLDAGAECDEAAPEAHSHCPAQRPVAGSWHSETDQSTENSSHEYHLHKYMYLFFLCTCIGELG